MVKGLLESVIALLFAIVLLIAMVSLFWTAIRNTGESSDLTAEEFTISPTIGQCSTDEQCAGNENGTICVQISSFESTLKTFCGCVTDDNCDRGVCGASNLCV